MEMKTEMKIKNGIRRDKTEKKIRQGKEEGNVDARDTGRHGKENVDGDKNRK